MKYKIVEPPKIEIYPLHSVGCSQVSLSNIRIEKISERIKVAAPFPHKHSFFQIMFIHNGKGLHQIDFSSYSLKKRQIFIMKPGQIHSWELAPDVDGFLIEFNRESVETKIKGKMELLNNVILTDEHYLLENEEEYLRLSKIVDLMFSEYSERKDNFDLSLQSLLTYFLIELTRSLTNSNQNKVIKNNNLTEKFFNLVEEHFKEEHSVEYYAQKLGISPKAMSMQISRTGSPPPRTIIQERLILESKRYLAFSKLSVSEIGYELGFNDPNYFTRFFRLHTKQSPVKYRKDLIK